MHDDMQLYEIVHSHLSYHLSFMLFFFLHFLPSFFSFIFFFELHVICSSKPLRACLVQLLCKSTEFLLRLTKLFLTSMYWKQMALVSLMRQLWPLKQNFAYRFLCVKFDLHFHKQSGRTENFLISLCCLFFNPFGKCHKDDEQEEWNETSTAHN